MNFGTNLIIIKIKSIFKQISDTGLVDILLYLNSDEIVILHFFGDKELKDIIRVNMSQYAYNLLLDDEMRIQMDEKKYEKQLLVILNKIEKYFNFNKPGIS